MLIKSNHRVMQAPRGEVAMRSADIASPAAAFRSGRQSPSSAERLADVRESHFVLADNRPVVIAGGAAPFQHCDNAFHRRFQFHLRVRATMRTLFRDAEGHHAIKDSWSAAAFWLVRFMVPATFHIDRFAFAMERGRNTFAQVSRFSQQVIDVAEDLANGRWLERIHGNRKYTVQSALRI